MKKFFMCPTTAATLLTLLISGGCGNWKITGEVEMARTDDNGDLVCEAKAGGIALTKGDVISIRLSSVFIREIKEIGGAEVLVYAEVYDIQPDDSQRLVKVLFNDEHQSEGYALNQNERILYGPVIYTGHPIRIRLFIVELDTGENELLGNAIKSVARIASTIQPEYAPFISIGESIGDLLIQLNEDDRELAYDFTLYPRTHSQGPYLKTGPIVLIKTEKRERVSSSGQNHLLVQDEWGNEISSSREDYTKLFSYDDDRNHPLRTEEPIRGVVALRVIDGALWLQNVAYKCICKKYGGNKQVEVILADPTAYCGPVSKKLPPGAQIVEYLRGGELVPYIELQGGETWYPLGERIQYSEKTHAVITVARGGEAHDRAVLVKSTKANQDIVAKALQKESSETEVRATLGEIKNIIIEAVTRKKLVTSVNDEVGLDPDCRKSSRFPLAYLKHLRVNDLEKIQNVIRNRLVIEIVNSMTSGFPYSEDDAKNKSKLEELKHLNAENFLENEDGTFRFSEKSVCETMGG